MSNASVRAFVAVDPSPETRAHLIRLVEELAATNADVRWATDTALHCTLKFLGDAEVGRLETLRDGIRDDVHGSAPIRVLSGGLGVFPSPRRPRVVWAGFEASELCELAAAVERISTDLGFRAEARRFTGHVTLGRVRSPHSWNRVEAVMKSHAGEAFGCTVVDRVVLYRSELRRGGALYTPLWTIPLGNSTLAQ